MNQQLRQQWTNFAAKIDKLSLRERCITFAVLVMAIMLGANTFFIEPQFLKQKTLSEKIKQEQAQISAIQAEIAQKITIKQVDPDAENKQRLLSAQQQLAELEKRMQHVQKDLIPPEKMGTLLENILKRNQKLQLVSLKTLPVSSVAEEVDINARAVPVINPVINPAGAPASVAADGLIAENGVIYKHGFEIVVSGNYLDMLTYMRELEQMPEQVYWSKARIRVDTYPTASLTLTLFTLSLEKKWLNL
ncbi:MSHA biogenesis protein MshJ [Undibacterium sp. Rencai35W]|uniref:MSHA biogenesis protein MshJ n=1 Tax=Undibacterium sp. Rencai35W TaxID=3413046 RepID=UPI003BF0035B